MAQSLSMCEFFLYCCFQRQVKSHAPQLKHGETTYVQNTSYFLGQLKPGQTLQSFENNLYRAPVYSHEAPSTDFLLTVSGDKVYLRELKDMFVIGQQCPKVEVPAPGSKPATQFQKELLQVLIWYCMVWCGMVWCGIVWYGVVWYQDGVQWIVGM